MIKSKNILTPTSICRHNLAIAMALPIITTPVVFADNLFTLDGVVYNNHMSEQHGSFSSNSIEELADTLSNTGLKNIFSSYNENSAARVDLSIRGLKASASYLSNDTTLHFQVLESGQTGCRNPDDICLSFNGRTRDESQEMFEDFLKGNGNNILTKLLQKLAKESPVDPVAGNPSSLQGQMTASTFGVATGIGNLADPGRPINEATGVWTVPNLLTVGGDIGIIESGGFDSTVIKLPLRYSYYFDDPRYALTFDLPLTYLDTEGAKTGMLSLGIAFRIPVLENWYLTPSVRTGATGSQDLGSAAIMYSGDISSLYNIYVSDFKISIGNSFGYYTTQKLSFDDISIDYDLANTITNNGVGIEGSLGFSLLGQPASWQAYIVDTNIFGDELFLEHYDEIGFLIGSRQSMDSQTWDSLRFGLSWTTGDDYDAFKVNFSYRF